MAEISIEHSAKCSKSFLRHCWPDLLLAFILAIAAGVVSYFLQCRMNTHLLEFRTWDVWFDDDTPRVIQMVHSFAANHNRAKVHPLFGIVGVLQIAFFRDVLGFSFLVAIRLMVASCTSAWMAAFYGFFRAMRLPRLSALLFCLVAGTSATAFFWTSIPESFLYGSVTILIALFLAARSDFRPFRSIYYVIVGTLTVGMTVTNWMVGIAVTIVNHTKKKAALITVGSFGLLVVVWAVVRAIIPSTQFPFRTSEEQYYMLNPNRGGLWNVVQGLFFHSVVAPAFIIEHRPQQTNFSYLRFQMSQIFTGSNWAWVAVSVWIFLFGVGLWALWVMREQKKLRWVLGLSLLGQFLLHSVYGWESFLYAPHELPLLLGIAALGTKLSKLRHIVLASALILVIFGGVNNYIMWNKAAKVADKCGPSPYSEPRGHMPTDHW